MNSGERNKAIVRTIIRDGFCGGDLTVAEKYCASDFVNRISVLEVPPGPDGMRLHIENARRGFPDLDLEILQMVAEDELVCVLWRTHATHGGPFMGVEASGAQQSVLLIGFWRFRDEKLVEWFGNFESLSLLIQMQAVKEEQFDG